MASTDKSKDYLPRISQIDASILNGEAYTLVKEQLLAAVKYTGQNILTKLEPEIDAVLHFLVLRNTIVRARSSVGQQLLQIKYADSVSSARLANYVSILVLARWLKHRIGDIISRYFKSEGTRLKFRKCVDVIEIVYKVSELANMLMFLYQGQFPSLGERMLGLRQVSANPGNVRRISYTYFTRELLWHGFAELLTFVLPMINVQHFHNAVRRLLPSSAAEDDSEEQPEVAFVAGTTCVVCNEAPALPHTFGCRHLACYYCIHANTASDPTFCCPLCGHHVQSKVQIIPMYTQATDAP